MQFCQLWCLVLFINGSCLCSRERNGGVCTKRLTFVGASAVIVSETSFLVSYHCSTVMIILEMLLHFLFLFCMSVNEQATYVLLSIMHTCGSPYTSVFLKTFVLHLCCFYECTEELQLQESEWVSHTAEHVSIANHSVV
jgi:hypothetical protein